MQQQENFEPGNENANWDPSLSHRQEIYADKPHKRKRVFALLLLALAAGITLAILWQQYNQALNFQDNSKKIITIYSGEKASAVISDLADKNLIAHPAAANFFVYFSGANKKIKSGSYSVSASMTPREIIDAFAAGSPKNYYVVRILEGRSNYEIGQYLEQNNFATAGDFDAALKSAAQTFDYVGETGQPGVASNLEGYIFPDTYFISKKNTAVDLVSKALQNTETKFTPQMISDIRAQGQTVYQILTLASIIEKEVGRNVESGGSATAAQLDAERKTVAGVFYNRLAQGMPLQSDATIAYILRQKISSATIEQTKISSPYNTYKNTGLPPGPIGNPSLSSIMAAIYPAKTDNLYFLMKPDGTAVFARTLQEQDQNKAKYLR